MFKEHLVSINPTTVCYVSVQPILNTIRVENMSPSHITVQQNSSVEHDKVAAHYSPGPEHVFLSHWIPMYQLCHLNQKYNSLLLFSLKSIKLNCKIPLQLKTQIFLSNIVMHIHHLTLLINKFINKRTYKYLQMMVITS